jgi:type I restriction enzyme, S subunit
MSEWKECRLGNLAEITSSKRIFYSDYVLEGIPFYRSKEIIEKSLGETGGEPLYISREKYFEIKEKFGSPQNGDLLISAVGERSGIPFVVRNQGDFYFKDGNLIWLRNIKPRLDIEYFCYWIKSSSGQMALESIMIGSAQKALTIVGLKDLEIPLPPISEQQAIAGVLSSLDDKIDLLHRQNKTLEGMAEALYRHFFVDNRQATWQECTVGEVADHEKTSIHPNRKPDALFYHYSIPAFDESHMPVHELGVAIQSSKYKVIKNTVLFSKLNPHKDKRIWLIPGPIPDNSVCSTEFQVIHPKAEKYLFFLYGFVSHPENYDEIAAGVGGTSSSHQRIDPEVIFKAICFLPDDRTLNTYNEIIGPIFDKMYRNLNSMYTLSRLRDTLLPKLMSGKVRVKL